MATLGIDLGTSSVKVLALSEAGKVLAKASSPYPLRRPKPDRAEQSPIGWMIAVGRACREVAGKLRKGMIIRAIGLAGQLNGFVLLDGRNRLLQDAVIWLDLRAQAIAEELKGKLGTAVLSRTANPLAPIAVLSKLAWMMRYEPSKLSRTKRLLMVKDYAYWRLTGEWLTDLSDASATGLLDYRRGVWDARMLAAAGVEPEIMPPIALSTVMPGRLSKRAAARLGLKPGIPVAIGAGDVTALAVGCGLVAPGIVGVTLGTAGHVVHASAHAPRPSDGRLWRMKHAVGGLEIWLGLVMGGGLCMQWARALAEQASGTAVSYRQLLHAAGKAPVGADGVTFLPFLEGAATPYQQPAARGSFHGLASRHGAGSLVRAVMEGVACNVCDCIALFEARGAAVDSVRLGEGGSQSPLWCQIIADFIGNPASLLSEPDASALGAAVIAQAGLQQADVGEVAGRQVRTATVFEPDPTRAAASREALARYRSLVQAQLSLLG